jgi:hypothetical protein
MNPLFESAGREFEVALPFSPLPVRADEARLTGALFVFLEYLYRYLPLVGLVTMSADWSSEERAEVLFISASSLPVSPASGGANQACETELLWRTALAAGGEVTCIDNTPGCPVWLMRLPLA